MKKGLYTPQEAAVVTETPLSVVQKAITTKQLPIAAAAYGKRRLITERAILAIAFSRRLPQGIVLTPAQAFQILETVEPNAQVTVGNAVRINLGDTLKRVRLRLALLEHARKLVTPRIGSTGQTTVIKGTTISVETILQELNAGETVETLHTKHPLLDRETIEAIHIWAEANPPRGRPKRQEKSLSVLTPRDLGAWTKTMQIAARQIDAWAGTRDAQAMLPCLIRKLVHLSDRITKADVPAGDSVSSAGWDGLIVCEKESPWIPKGRSYWEMSCDGSPTTKANHDYNKRTLKTPSAERRKTTLVIVTGRRWGQKAKWLKQKLAEETWYDIRVYDADDLEQWLEQSPTVALWFADLLGLTGHGVESLQRFWESWSQQTKPPLSKAAILTGRAHIEIELMTKIDGRLNCGQIDPIGIKADSVGEAVAFAAVAVIGKPALCAASLVVTDTSGWRFVEQNPLIKLAIAVSPEVAEKPTRRNGLIVIIPFAAGDIAGQYRGSAAREPNEVILNRPKIHEFEHALTDIGIEPGDAGRLAVVTGRSWSVFQRQYSSNPALKEPVWLKMPQAAALSTVCLLGSWSSASEADRELVTRIAARPYEDIERDLKSLGLVDDAPVVQIGLAWKAKSPLELLNLFGGRITQDEMARFFIEAEKLLAQEDPLLELPEEKRFAAGIYGKVREHSPILIAAICDTLIKLAVRGPDNPSLNTLNIEGRVNTLVSDLLQHADGKRWLSLASFLPALAEAAPEVFLDAVRKSLGQPQAPIKQLFSETGSAAFMGRCWHSGLLWALETLAWAPNRLTHVTLLLADLSHVKIKGNWGNKPINSLVDIFRSWIPQTAATLEQRIAALDKLIKHDPEIASSLFDMLVHGGHDIASPNARPGWRDDDSGAGRGATGIDQHKMMFAIADRQINLAKGHSDRICSLINKIEVFDDTLRKRVLHLVEDYTAPQSSMEDQVVLRNTLRKKIHWHLNYGEGQKGKSNLLKELQTIYDRLAPQDLVARYAWLFSDGWPDLPIRENISARADSAERLRIEALNEIMQAQSFAGVEKLARACPHQPYVGGALAKIKMDTAHLINWISDTCGDLTDVDPLRATVWGILRSLSPESSRDLLKILIEKSQSKKWNDGRLVRLLTLAPIERSTWELAQACGAEIEKLYWDEVNPGIWMRNDGDDFTYALKRLVAAKRSGTALQMSHLDFRELDPALIAEMLEGILRGEEKEKIRFNSWELGEAVKALEDSSAITKDRLVRIEFGLMPAFGIDSEQRLAGLYDAVMSDPKLFAELITLVYKPAKGEAKNLTDTEQAFATSAWQLLHHCKRLPGTQPDGDIDVVKFKDFIDQARMICAEADRLDVYDTCVGEILAHSPAGNDGIWPFEPTREIMDHPEMECMRKGFITGALNKRGVTMRGYDEGGGQERTLAQQIRGHAQALEISHPYVAATLNKLAHWYEEDGKREDISAELRTEGY